jgi:hypothetical protein
MDDMTTRDRLVEKAGRLAELRRLAALHRNGARHAPPKTNGPNRVKRPAGYVG